MNRFIVETDSAANGKLLLRLMKEIKFVKSVKPADKHIELPTVGDAEEEYNWINPTRPATDEEFEQMISEAEKEQGIPAEKARKLTMKEIDRWMKDNTK